MRFYILFTALLLSVYSCGGVTPRGGGAAPNDEEKKELKESPEQDNVIPQVDSQPQPGGFIEGVYIKTVGTCPTDYGKVGIKTKPDGSFEIYGVEGFESVIVTPEGGKGCFEWKDANCCLTQKGTSVVLACTFADSTTCESIYEKDSEFDFDNVFSSIKSTSFDVEDVLRGTGRNRFNDIVINSRHTFNAFTSQSYATFRESDITLNQVSGSFMNSDTNVRWTDFDVTTDFRVVGNDFVIDAKNKDLYWFDSRLRETEDPSKQTGSLKIVAQGANWPVMSNHYLLWFDASKKTLFLMSETKTTQHREYPLPLVNDILGAAYMDKNLYILIQKGESLDVMTRSENVSGEWISMGLDYKIVDNEKVEGAALLAKKGIVVVSMKGEINVYTCPNKSWRHFNFNDEDKIIYLTSNGFFASDKGHMYTMKGNSQFDPFFVIDVFISPKLIFDGLSGIVTRYYEVDRKLYFLIPSQEKPDKVRLVGWIEFEEP